MALTHHDDIELVAGDSWTILGTLLDENGVALNLSGIIVLWSMRGVDGATLTDLVAATIVTKLDPLSDGKISIAVPAGATVALEAGRCHDFVRISVGGIEVDTMWIGAINVAADPHQLDQA